jgi:hypothetical protein
MTSEFAQPANIFFGHLLAIVIGILFNEFLGNVLPNARIICRSYCNINDVF